MLYEQGPIPNPLASSCDQHRLIRFTYGAMTGYARMVHEAYAAWERLWADLGRSHYRATGTLMVAREDDGWVGSRRSVWQAWRLPFETGRRPSSPAPAVPRLLGAPRYALYTPTGGVLFAERILAISAVG